MAWPYDTPEWRYNIRPAAIQAAGHRCEDCGTPSHQLPRGDASLHGDHITPVSEGGAPFDIGNVRVRCNPCHARKTNADRKRRGDRTASLPFGMTEIQRPSR